MLVKHGHALVLEAGALPLRAGDHVRVGRRGRVGVLMNDGFPPSKRERGTNPSALDPFTRDGFVVVKFGRFAVPMHPEVIKARWKELK